MKRWVALFCLAMTSCNTDEAEFPEVVTLEAQEIGSTGAVIGAEIKEVGTIRPVRFGFLWGADPALNFLNAPGRADLGSTETRRMFSIRLETLSPGTTYFARGYSANADYSRVYYGNEIRFTTLP